ncbi:hypothetical protein AB5D91_004612 [Salmonella enterica]|uniref:hypothetical protein n=1 Tax=Salmonella enterica TaxID=28901 RepID=UPI0015869845|nr:hypothetical protein [Salmonella enterica]EEL9261400.1 hypothetical protein [Salmonella enterica subsp. enterica serovar Enteritidis]EEM3073076.1 hypothetical protein [Salmonella enterica subsp. enterica serovar Java]EHE8613147.1 hypothetical protein [Salmonella enterica subsp. enterica serovar 4,[5],12:b:-]EDT0782295.1 hypothetical protein [Salmonella enterica]EDZ3737703.1 hypothetical protein [Salmonella enterica]
MTALLSQKAQEVSPRYRSLLPVGCSPRPVTGQADRGIPQTPGLWRQGYAAKAA